MENQFEKLSQCPYCFSTDLFFLFKSPDRLAGMPGDFSLNKCQCCGLVFQNPRVKEEFIGEYYTAKLHYYQPNETPFSLKENWKKRLKNFLKKQTLYCHFNYFLQKKNPLFFCLTLPWKRFIKIAGFPCFQPQGTVLEIGCSHGEFLQELKNLRWNVQGVEMDEKSAVYGREKRGLDIYNKKIEQCDFPAKSFNAVIMRMVLEHLYHPFDALKQAAFWLKPQGELIFSIPYIYGLESILFKSYFYGLQLPYHIVFFNKRIIRSYLKKIGFSHIKFYHHYFDRDIVASSQYKYQATKSFFYKILGYNKIIRFAIIKPFVFLLSLLGKTSRITVVAKKNS